MEQKSFDTEMDAVCDVSVPKVSFEADLLLDIETEIELKHSHHMADQLGLPYRPGERLHHQLSWQQKTCQCQVDFRCLIMHFGTQ